MFWTEEAIARRIAELEANDAHICELRNRQMVLVNDLDKENVAGRDGARSMVEWQSRLDMSRRNASELVYGARRFKKHRRIHRRLIEGLVSMDRAIAVLRLAVAAADDSTIEESSRLDQQHIARLAARQRRVSTVDEQQAFQNRHSVPSSKSVSQIAPSAASSGHGAAPTVSECATWRVRGSMRSSGSSMSSTWAPWTSRGTRSPSL